MRLKGFFQLLCKFVILFTLTACNQSVSAAKSNCSDSAQQFWKTFREAVVKNDIDAIAKMTHYPLVLSIGILDEGRVNKQLDRKVFITVMPRLFKNDSGMSETPTTMQDYAKALNVIPSQFCTEDGKQFHVGDWVFQLQSVGWRFVQAHVDDEFKL